MSKIDWKSKNTTIWILAIILGLILFIVFIQSNERKDVEIRELTKEINQQKTIKWHEENTIETALEYRIKEDLRNPPFTPQQALGYGILVLFCGFGLGAVFHGLPFTSRTQNIEKYYDEIGEYDINEKEKSRGKRK